MGTLRGSKSSLLLSSHGIHVKYFTEFTQVASGAGYSRNLSYFKVWDDGIRYSLRGKAD